MFRKFIALNILLISFTFADCDDARTQREMNECAEEMYLSYKSKLELSLEKIGSEIFIEAKKYLFLQSQEPWASYVESHCRVISTETGTMGGMLYYGCMKQKYEDRILEVSKYTCHPMLESCN